MNSIRNPPTDPPALQFSDGRVPSTILQTTAIDVLVADHSSDRNMNVIFGADHSLIPEWMEWVRQCPDEMRPRVIVQVWPSWSITKEPGPSTKFPRKTLERCGYDLRYQVVNASDHGSPVNQNRLVIIGLKRDSPQQTEWDFRPQPSFRRSMSNCLRPYGVGPCRDSLPEGQKATTEKVPNSVTDPMPCTVKDWIKTPAGYRRLHCDELAKGLGVDRTITSDPTMIPARMLDDLVGEHLWETIFAQVGELLSSTPQASTPTTEPPPMETPSPDNEERFSSVEGKWEWKPKKKKRIARRSKGDLGTGTQLRHGSYAVHSEGLD